MKTSCTATTPERIRIGEWVLVPSLHLLERPGRRVTLRRKLVDVLSCLCREPGMVLAREELLARAWPDATVTEDALTRVVSELRSILEDDPASPRYIETIRKGGYRLVAPVLREQPAASPTGRSAPAARQSGASPGGGAPSEPEHALSPARGPVAFLGIAAAVASALLLWVWPPGGRSAGAPSPPGASSPFRPGGSWSGLPRPVTSFPGRETDASLSRDGTLVVFAWSGPGRENYDIYVKPATGDGLTRLTHHPDPEAHPAWSPDGQRVAFVRWSPAGARILEVGARGGPPRFLAPAGLWATGLDWSPDGSRLVYSLKSSREEPQRLAILSLGSGQVTILTHPGRHRRDSDPAWSPDGSGIAFVRGDLPGRRQQICVLQATGGEPACHSTGGRTLRGLDWAGDGRRVIVSAGRSEDVRLFSVNPGNGRLRELMVRAEQVAFPSMSGDSRRLIFESAENHQGLWRLGPLGPKPGPPSWERVLASTFSEGDAAFSPDGRHLAFISNRSGSLEIWLADGTLAQPGQLTRSGGHPVSRPRWSPSGRRLAYQEDEAGVSLIKVISIPGGAPRTALRQQGSLLLSGWSAAGEALYFGAEDAGGWKVWRLGLDDGTIRVAVPRDAVQAQESPDGRWLYFSGADRSGIWRVPVSGGEAELVAESLPPLDAGAWTLAAGKIFMVETEGGETRVVSVDLDTRQVTFIARTSWFLTPSVSVSPDGTSLLVSRTSYGGSDIMMIESFHELL